MIEIYMTKIKQEFHDIGTIEVEISETSKENMMGKYSHKNGCIQKEGTQEWYNSLSSEMKEHFMDGIK